MKLEVVDIDLFALIDAAVEQHGVTKVADSLLASSRRELSRRADLKRWFKYYADMMLDGESDETVERTS